MKIVGIAGGTASGKSTLSRRLTLELGAAVLAHDSYYRTLPDAFRGERMTEYNFDHPDAFDTQLLVETLTKLKAGKRVEIPIYNFKVQFCTLFDISLVLVYVPKSEKLESTHLNLLDF